MKRRTLAIGQTLAEHALPGYTQLAIVAVGTGIRIMLPCKDTPQYLEFGAIQSVLTALWVVVITDALEIGADFAAVTITALLAF